MILEKAADLAEVQGTPRASGGDPGQVDARIEDRQVLPAQAGVILSQGRGLPVCMCTPRASGGDPNHFEGDMEDSLYSPRKRG